MMAPRSPHEKQTRGNNDPEPAEKDIAHGQSVHDYEMHGRRDSEYTDRQLKKARTQAHTREMKCLKVLFEVCAEAQARKASPQLAGVG
jgi:hypothetical protein